MTEANGAEQENAQEYLIGCWKPTHQATVAVDIEELDDMEVAATVGRLSLIVAAPDTDEAQLKMRALENVVSVERNTSVKLLTGETSDGGYDAVSDTSAHTVYRCTGCNARYVVDAPRRCAACDGEEFEEVQT